MSYTSNNVVITSSGLSVGSSFQYYANPELRISRKNEAILLDDKHAPKSAFIPKQDVRSASPKRSPRLLKKIAARKGKARAAKKAKKKNR